MSAGLEVAAAAIGHGVALGASAGSHAGHKIEQVVHVTAVERSLKDLLAFDDSLQRGAVGVQIAGGAGYGHGLRHVANLQSDVHAGGAADLDVHRADSCGLEARLRYGHAVGAGIEVDEVEGAAIAGSGLFDGVRAVVLQCDLGADHMRSGRIGDRSNDSSIACLGPDVDAAGGAEQERKRQKRGEGIESPAMRCALPWDRVRRAFSPRQR